jgi:hypothetical protein
MDEEIEKGIKFEIMNGLLIFFIYLFDNFCVNIEAFLLGLSDGEDYQWHRRF